jgi:5'-nucleotidase
MPVKLYKILILIIVSGLLNKIMISCEEKNIHVKKIKGNQIIIDQNIKSDSAFIAIIKPYKDKLKNNINTVLCYNPRTLKRDESEFESSLGNFYADVCFQKADSIFQIKTNNNIDFALFNYGGIRTSIPKGNITIKNIFELMPFENTLVIAELEAEQIQLLLSYLESRKEAHPISHLKLEMKENKLINILINNQALDISKKYYVLTHDYLLSGGDNMDFFKQTNSKFNTEYKVRDVLIDYLSSIDTLKTNLDGRFIKVN